VSSGLRIKTVNVFLLQQQTATTPD